MSDDDEEPLTSDWLDAVMLTGGASIRGGFTLHVYAMGGAEIQYARGNPFSYDYETATIDLPDPKTRGDVRVLCRALGVALNEPAPATAANTGETP